LFFHIINLFGIEKRELNEKSINPSDVSNKKASSLDTRGFLI